MKECCGKKLIEDEKLGATCKFKGSSTWPDDGELRQQNRLDVNMALHPHAEDKEPNISRYLSME